MCGIELTFVGDRMLGPMGLSIVKHYFPEAQGVIWGFGDRTGKKEARAKIRRQRPDVLLSFHSDLILTRDEIRNCGIVLNIHPGLPTVPGLGYDIVPLIEGHSHFGATLHFIEDEGIDQGRIIAVEENHLPEGLSYPEMRLFNQGLSLRLLRKTVKILSACRRSAHAQQVLESLARTTQRTWTGDYVSLDMLRTILEELLAKHPRHPALIGHPLVKELIPGRPRVFGGNDAGFVS